MDFEDENHFEISPVELDKEKNIHELCEGSISFDVYKNINKIPFLVFSTRDNKINFMNLTNQKIEKYIEIEKKGINNYIHNLRYYKHNN